MGKADQNVGDLLEGFDADPSLASLQEFVADPRANAPSLLGKATTRLVYDLDRFRRCGEPPWGSSMMRETHLSEVGGSQTNIQISFSYSDGFAREIQRKIQAESGPAPKRERKIDLPSGDITPGALARDANGNLIQVNVAQRWVGTGRTVFNNKGQPIKRYEPFFSATPLYEEEQEMTDTGVSLIHFYDPAGRIVTTLYPNQTYEKFVVTPWQMSAYDLNDTAAPSRDGATGDPRTDGDVAGYVGAYFNTQTAPWVTWYAQRIRKPLGDPEREAAEKASGHSDTPTVVHFDALGRSILSVAHNRFERNGLSVNEHYPTRWTVDIEGNHRAVVDAKDRIVMRYDYDLLGRMIHHASMEAGERWMLDDATSRSIRLWNTRGHLRRIRHDELRRPIELYVTEAGVERLAERTIYGEANGNIKNQRTRVHQIFDAAGVITNDVYDFKGNLVESKRELLTGYKISDKLARRT